MIMLYGFFETEYNYRVSWKSLNINDLSKFDNFFAFQWKTAEEKGAFRYDFKGGPEKTLRGNNCFLAQFIPGRTNRRFPEAMKSLSDPFDPSKFNFTRVKENEVLFEIKKQGMEVQELDRHFVIVNNSPLGHCHSLLLPKMYQCLPQVATLEGLELATTVMLLSSSPAMRIGFNSLLAHASVNHLHFHIYYLKTPMLLETIQVQHFSGPCFVLLDYPAHAFMFQLTDCDVQQLARNVHCLTSHLHKMDIAHNIFFTRGLKSGGRSEPERDTIRVYVWVRESAGIKDPAAFTPAVCELFGHLCFKSMKFWYTNSGVLQGLQRDCMPSPVHCVTEGGDKPYRYGKFKHGTRKTLLARQPPSRKAEEDYNSATEEKVGNIFREICEEKFSIACESVKLVFGDKKCK